MAPMAGKNAVKQDIFQIQFFLNLQQQNEYIWYRAGRNAARLDIFYHYEMILICLALMWKKH